MRAGGGAAHARDTDHLSSLDALPFGNVDTGQVAVERLQAIAMVDLDREPAQAGVAVGVEPTGRLDDAGSGRGHRLIGEGVVVTVMAVVVQAVMAAGRLCVPLAEARIRSAGALRRELAVVAADAAVELVLGGGRDGERGG